MKCSFVFCPDYLLIRYEFSHKCETKIEHISPWGKNVRSFKRTVSCVGRGKQKKSKNWHPESASDRPDLTQRHLFVESAGHMWNGLLCCVHGVRSYHTAVKTDRLTMKFGRAAGNIWASPWSLWHDTPGSEAWRQSTHQSASHWPRAILKGQAWLHLHHSSHLQHKQDMTWRSRHRPPMCITSLVKVQTVCRDGRIKDRLFFFPHRVISVSHTHWPCRDFH